MKLPILALFMAPMIAHAGNATFECDVISNGSGKDWTNVFHFSTPAAAKTNLPKTAVTAYGNTLSIEATLTTETLAPNFQTSDLRMTVYINNDQVALYASDSGEGQTRLTGNLLDTRITFMVKPNTAAPISYDAHCAMKPTP